MIVDRLSMMMAAIAVNVTVREFFFCSIPHFHHFHIKVQFHARQFVIGVYRYIFKTHISYSDYASLVGGELHPGFYFLITERTARHFLNHIRIFFAISFGRFYF